METQSTQPVRKHWSFVIAYCLGTSLTLGCFLPAILFVWGVLQGTFEFGGSEFSHSTIQFLLFSMATLSAGAFIVQILTDPVVITRDIICDRCHITRRLDRNFLLQLHFRMPECDCGGKFESAIFWKWKS